MPITRGGIRLSLSFQSDLVMLNGTLRGEAVLDVKASHKNGVPYEAIRLELLGVERNCVRDDQGEFDALLYEYTSDRTYLSRHLTLCGTKSASEETEMAEQVLQELILKERRSAPYASVVQPKRVKPLAPSVEGAELPAPRAVSRLSPELPATGTTASRASGAEENHVLEEDAHVPRDGSSTLPPNSAMGNASRGSHAKGWQEVGGAHKMAPATADGEQQLFSPASIPDGSSYLVYEGTAAPPVQAMVAEETLASVPPVSDTLTVSHRLMPGRYAFPFVFHVPPWLPPSLYYNMKGACGSIRYTVTVRILFRGSRQDLVQKKPFYVLSTISQRQLLACQEEAIRAATVVPLPPLAAQFQVFACSCLGNLCCLRANSFIDVEVALQSSRALVLADASAVYRAFVLHTRKKAEADPQDPAPAVGTPTGRRAYDAFAERGWRVKEDNRKTSQAAIVGSGHTPGTVDSYHGSGLTEREQRQHHQAEALRRRREEVEVALPLPACTLPLLVHVRNRCETMEIPTVRVELCETVQVFKSLEAPRVFQHPLSRYDYTVSIPPGTAVTFPVQLLLPKQFRRCEEDDATLPPPPGVRTATLRTSTTIAIHFPGLPVYTLEEDWTTGIVQLAEAVDAADEVLDLPVQYS